MCSAGVQVTVSKGSEFDPITGLAWGDMDGDGDLDLAVAERPVWDSGCLCYQGGVNKVYLNVDGALQSEASWTSNERDWSNGLAWGDVNGDGLLDLAVANRPIWDEASQSYLGGANRVYLNLGGSLEASASWSSSETDFTTSLAWGDVNGDGWLDLAAGNRPVWDQASQGYLGGENRVYLNQGGVLNSSAAWSSNESDWTTSLAWGDMDGDGDLDLAAGNSPIWDESSQSYLGGEDRLYLNLGTGLETAASWVCVEKDRTTSLAWRPER
jgi:hypothetical protein